MNHSRRLVARRLGWDRNPLRRGIDRAEAIAVTALLVAFLVGGPLMTVAAGRAADAAGLGEQKIERTWSHRQAVVLAGAGQQFGTYGMLSMAWVPARWTLPDGERRTGTVTTGPDTLPGQRVEIWLTPGPPGW